MAIRNPSCGLTLPRGAVFTTHFPPRGRSYLFFKKNQAAAAPATSRMSTIATHFPAPPPPPEGAGFLDVAGAGFEVAGDGLAVPWVERPADGDGFAAGVDGRAAAGA